jgi:uncharacterized membrane protein YeaQ/YmgE (transglycosylase-associated protein family)
VTVPENILLEAQMTFVDFLLLLAIAAIAGAIGQALAGHSLGGLFISIIVGFVGAAIGSWLAGQFHFPTFFVVGIGGEKFPIIWAIIGSALLSAALGFISRQRKIKI